ncbi:hypothetical protein ABW286_21555 [Erwinia papayae]|uniref:Uncharacterized protein n=1 Tax=Erwinia papayae TaxID=206499 RepID=A0ABV3N7B6_9GAMM|nr:MULTISPECIES: hypothetical protein [Enterobacterales]MCI3067303.1 hypothetical protein [Escherichia coli]TBL98028.1 hypothetical protein EYY93_17715 [Hafnia paralvei]
MEKHKCCHTCRIVTDKLYRFQEDDQPERVYCLLCFEQQTDELATDSTVGYYGVKRHPRASFALLKRAMIHALNSPDEVQQNKAKLVLRKLSESAELIADTYGSNRSDDLRDVLARHGRLILLDSEKDIQQEIIAEKDNFPDASQWAEIYSRRVKK